MLTLNADTADDRNKKFLRGDRGNTEGVQSRESEFNLWQRVNIQKSADLSGS